MVIIHEISMDIMDEVGRSFLDLVEPARAPATDNEDIAGYLHRGQDLRIPSYLDGQLDDYMLVLDAAPMDPVLITSRVKAILLTIIAVAEKHYHDLTSLSSEDLRRLVKNLYVSFNQAVTIPTLVDGETHYLRAIADGILWCGSERELEANLVIQITDGEVDGQARLPPIMLMLHHGRRISARPSEIYGIITNSYKWRFLRIDNDSRYFEVTLDWNNEVERKKIANLLRDIAYDAMRLAINRPAPLNEHDASVYEMSECRIWTNKAESEQLLVDESD